ncbi:MAG: bifunctional diaminohydroxyphosphoribosylaminopyrimidine deaminase/5-amino-6-(5-phosphoribosylamino)uracil reductase RibD [Nitriliruptorales bacterium]|nr:bifunctional diaminohydroxyphosphoribosylaminopyrimidine deaminase/5-amino-6-(5-phosphoribosylamino)uracil reductase RibD [Nitriliruptorales bacterium]
MRRALDLAERGRGTVSPNPLVGCVLVAGDEIVGEGWHAAAGGPHAEVVALRAAGERAAGAVVYVTLEPCAHIGRTGPCVDALLESGVAEVVAALPDPNPTAAGGADMLRAAGVAVRLGVLADEAAQQNRVFLHNLATSRPFVVLKSAVSLDGRIAAADGTSRWLTGNAARERAHRLRAQVDAVLVGSGTALTDDPRLTVRLPDQAATQPLRVVLDGRGRVPATARVFDGEAPTLLFTALGAASATRRALGEKIEARSVDVVAVPTAPGGALDVHAILTELYRREVRCLLIEGGATVAGSFLRAGLVDELVCHLAPLLLGERGRPLLTGDLVGTLAEAWRFEPVDVEVVGPDVLLTLAPADRPQSVPDPPAAPVAADRHTSP